jgi:hypothetical protein
MACSAQASRWQHKIVFANKAYFIKNLRNEIFIGTPHALLKSDFSLETFDTLFKENGATFDYAHFESDSLNAKFVITSTSNIYWLNSLEKTRLILRDLDDSIVTHSTVTDVYVAPDTPNVKVYICTNNGLFVCPLQEFNSENKSILAEQVLLHNFKGSSQIFFHIIKFQSRIIVANDKGIFYLKPKYKLALRHKNRKFQEYKVKRLSNNIKGKFSAIVSLKNDRGQDYLIGVGNNFMKLESKEWLTFLNSFCGIFPKMEFIQDVEVTKNYVWMTSQGKLFRYTVSGNTIEIDSTLSDSIFKHDPPKKCMIDVINDTLFVLPSSGKIIKVISPSSDTTKIFYSYILDRTFSTKFKLKDKQETRWDTIVKFCIADWESNQKPRNRLFTYPKGNVYELPNAIFVLADSNFEYPNDPARKVLKNRKRHLADIIDSCLNSMKQEWNDIAHYEIRIITDGTDRWSIRRKNINKIKRSLSLCHCHISIQILIFPIERHSQWNDLKKNFKYIERLKRIGVIIEPNPMENYLLKRKGLVHFGEREN